MKTNLSTAQTNADGGLAPYATFPAQAARIPPTKSVADLSKLNTLPSSPALDKIKHVRASSISNPALDNIKHVRASSISNPVIQASDAVRDLHLSGEPRIFPGVVSRGQRRESVASREAAMEKTPEKGKTRAQLLNDSMALEALSDEEMEEAGGMDELV